MKPLLSLASAALVLLTSAALVWSPTAGAHTHLRVAAAPNLYTPEEAVHDALTDDLQLVGKFTPKYSESHIPSCVFRGKKVLLLVSYCRKGVLPAASIRFHPIDSSRGHADVYAEVKPGHDITTSTRADYYDVTWSIDAARDVKGFSFNMTAPQYMKYDAVQSVAHISGCVTGKSFKALCQKGFEDQVATWGAQTSTFYDEPGAEWYSLLKALKAKIK